VLGSIAAHPQHFRRVLGSLLDRWGLEADAEHLPIVLHYMPQGVAHACVSCVSVRGAGYQQQLWGGCDSAFCSAQLVEQAMQLCCMCGPVLSAPRFRGDTGLLLLQKGGPLVIRRLCAAMGPEVVFREFASILDAEADLAFASTMVQVCQQLGCGQPSPL
jgi:hypothetical protein